MTLDGAIEHCEEVADGMTEQGKCEECAAEHRQLANWLKELKDYRERMTATVESEPKIGHWIYTLEDWNRWECSECGYTKRTDVHVKIGYKFCPNCGAKMEKESEEFDNLDEMLEKLWNEVE